MGRKITKKIKKEIREKINFISIDDHIDTLKILMTHHKENGTAEEKYQLQLIINEILEIKLKFLEFLI